MSFRLDERETNKQFATYLKQLEDRITALESANPLTHASIEGGALDVYDDDGNLRGHLGVQPDGTFAARPVNSTPPPTPAGPTVEPALSGLIVAWDGLWADADEAPADFATVQIHVGPDLGFEPDETTLAGTISTPLGGSATIAVAGYEEVWVRLRAVNTAALTGEPGEAAPGTPRQAVPQDLIDEIIDETKLAQDAVTEAKIALGAVGSAALADAAVTLGKIGEGAVTLNALGGALADGITQHYTDTMSDPAAWTPVQIPAGARWEHLADIADAPTGRTVGQARGYAALRGSTPIPYDPAVLYRISARVRTTAPSSAGRDTLYVGVMGFGADGVTMVNRTGANSTGSQFYCAASRPVLAAADGWTVYTGYLRGRAAPDATGLGGVAADPRAPGQLHDQVRYIAPYLLLNYDSGVTGPNTPTGVMQVDAVTVEVLKTGIVDSTNLVVGSVTTAALATDAVTAGKIAADAIGARELQANSVTASELTAGSVTALAIEAGAVTAEKILAGAVTTDKLVGLSVTAEKIASLAITTDKLSALSVTTDKLAVNSVTASQIAAGAIEATHIKAGAITAEKISADALNGRTITGATVQTADTGDRVIVTNDANGRGLLRFYNTANKLSAELSSGTDDTGMQAVVLKGPDPVGGWNGRPSLTIAADGGRSTATVKANAFEIRSPSPLIADRYVKASITGYLTASNIEVGHVTITPTPNVATSMTVTGLQLPLDATTIRGVATANTTVPGTTVRGIGLTDATPRTVTISINRTDNTPTGIDFILIAS
ncbi:hypothetical protein ACF08W_29025 [Streptomyces sp. NPDC015144]|uniref:hypothetical protein n=1 Tax=Streptomyces sp. NPDC015144 TaxID=3364944 RepID=UPI0036F66FCD